MKNSPTTTLSASKNTRYSSDSLQDHRTVLQVENASLLVHIKRLHDLLVCLLVIHTEIVEK